MHCKVIFMGVFVFGVLLLVTFSSLELGFLNWF